MALLTSANGGVYLATMIVDMTCAVCGKQFRRQQQRSITTHFCEMACKAEWQRRQRPVTVDWLRQKYSVEGLNCTQIGALVNRHPKSVWFWLTGSGIPTRPRGATTSGNGFKKGQPNRFAGRKHSTATKDRLRAARLDDGHVPYLKNGKHWLASVPREQHPNWKGGLTPERQALYASEEWRAAVKAVWARDDAKCCRCHLDCRTIPVGDRRKTFCIHHIVSFSVHERRADPTNLVLLCRPCHLFVHSKKNLAREFLSTGAYE